MIDDTGERVPLTIADHDDSSITVIYKIVGSSTKKLSESDAITELVGPLGNPSDIEPEKKVCFVAGGVGIAAVYPIAKAWKKENVSMIIGSRSKEFLFWEEKLKEISDNLIYCTDDGSYGEKGNTAQILEKYLNENFDLVFTVGPSIMMKFVAEKTRGKVKTISSINSIMVDGIGMCGCCRVEHEGQSKFCCVDGPDFDAHKIDWDNLLNRLSMYKEEEKTG